MYNYQSYSQRGSLRTRFVRWLVGKFQIAITALVLNIFALLSLLIQTVVYASFIAIPVWLLWNAVGASLLHCPTLDFWQVMVMLVIGRLVYKVLTLP
jgi:hypothetical protein